MPRRHGGGHDDAARLGDEAEAGQRGDLQAAPRRDLAGNARPDGELGGTHNFSIYRYGLLLFAYQELDHPPVPGAPIDPVVWKWWEMMAPYMETNADFSPVMEPVEEMFHAD